MIDIKEYKKAIPENVMRKLSEEQVHEARDLHDKLAEIIFDMWLVDNKKK